MDDGELARWRRFKVDDAKLQHIVARALVRTTLSRYFDVPAAAWRFTANRYGRPYIDVHLGARAGVVRAEDGARLLHVRHGEGVRAALPLRSTHAALLESLPAAVARHGGDRRRGAAAHRAGSELRVRRALAGRNKTEPRRDAEQ